MIDLDENPARELLAIFEQWKQSGTRKNGMVTAGVARDLSAKAGIELQVRACQLVAMVGDEIDRFESDGHDMAMYRRNFPTWARMVIAYPEGWKTNINPKTEFPVDKIDLLRALANYIEKIPFNSNIPVDAIALRLDELEALLDSDDSLDPSFCSYFRDLLSRARAAVDNFKRYGPDAVYFTLNSVIVAAKAAEGFSTDPKSKSRWGDFVRNYASNVAANATMLAASPIALQLASGLG